jgi:hypothetical protein
MKRIERLLRLSGAGALMLVLPVFVLLDLLCYLWSANKSAVRMTASEAKRKGRLLLDLWLELGAA